MFSAIRRGLRRLQFPKRNQVPLTLSLALAVNVILAGAYLWSRGGQTTVLEMEARGPSFVVRVDGKEQARQIYPDAPREGGLLIIMEDLNEVTSMPHPRGVDRVLVTSLDDEQVLLDETFSNPDVLSGWETSGRVAVRDGVATVEGNERGSLRFDANWTDYRVRITYRNLAHSTVRIRSTDDDSGAQYGFRPFRHLDNHLSLVEGGDISEGAIAPLLEPSKPQVIRSMLEMVLRPYPVMLAGLLVGALIAALVSFAGPPTFDVRLPRVGRLTPSAAATVVVALIALAVFGITLFLNYSYGAHMPHVPDEVSYLFQAKVLAGGHLTAPPPPSPESFQLGNPPLIQIIDGRWVSVYPVGHPLALAFGELFGAVWIVPPMIGAASVILIYFIGRRLFGWSVGLLAALVFAASPFFLMNASNFMSHNTAVLYLLLSLLFLVHAERRPLLFYGLAGVFFGLVFNTRPLTGAALIPPFGVMMLFAIYDRRLFGARQVAAFAAGALLMLLMYLAYRYGTTGDPLYSAEAQSGKDTFGFAGTHSTSAGVALEQTQLAYLLLVLNNWPAVVGLAFVLLPFALGTRNRWDWAFLFGTATLMGAYTLYYYHGVMYGPRFWYETTPFLALLTVRGADVAGRTVARAVSEASPRARAPSLRARHGALALSYGVVALLVVTGTRDWLVGDGGDWDVAEVPRNAKEMRNFNGIDDSLVRKLRDQKLEHALVLLKDCPSWQCYGNVAWMNSPWLNTDILVARDLEDRNADLFDAFPDRLVFRAEYNPYSGSENRSKLEPYASVPDSATVSNSAPLAAEIPRPTPVPTPTTDPLAAVRRDDRRKADLAALSDALAQYREDHGEYPASGNPQTVCTYDIDAACALKQYLAELPRDPLTGRSYRYQSDGVSFVLIASLENASSTSECSDRVLEPFGSVQNGYCVTGP